VKQGGGKAEEGGGQEEDADRRNGHDAKTDKHGSEGSLRHLDDARQGLMESEVKDQASHEGRHAEIEKAAGAAAFYEAEGELAADRFTGLGDATVGAGKATGEEQIEVADDSDYKASGSESGGYVHVYYSSA
jgi:hypothetical protein